MKSRLLLACIATILTVFTACNSENKKGKEVFSNKQSLEEFDKTVFVPTLEHTITSDSNYVYCATFLFAWEKIRALLDDSIFIDKKYIDLTLLDNSTSHKNVLNPEEYEIFAEISDEGVRAKSYFRKSLPFKEKLEQFSDRLSFNDSIIPSFGFVKEEFFEIVNILYYKNDNQFLIRLNPKLSGHEILLYKTDKTFSSFSDMMHSLEVCIERGMKEQEVQSKMWKYYIQPLDELLIPIIDFNIEGSFSKILASEFRTSEMEYTFDIARQQIAFKLDESGAEIESEAEIMCKEETEEVELPKPKLMHFNSSFFVILRKRDCNMPYFTLFVQNLELLSTEK